MSINRPLEILHTDLFGPTTYTSISKKYGFVVVDDFSRYTWVFYLNDNKKVFNIFKLFIKRCENEFKLKVKKVKGEFRNSKMDALYDDMEIKHELLVKHTPQSNELVERKNVALIDMTRSMPSEYNVSGAFWALMIVVSLE
jgi:predicted nuclease of restriction endonuclease-like RecB superfamily